MEVLASTKTLGTQPLAPFAVWDNGWNPNQGLQSEVMGCISVYSDQAGTVQIYQTDDPTNPLMTVPSGDSDVVTPYVLTTLQIVITHAYWRAVVTNQGTQQTIFEAVVTQSQSVDVAILLELKKLRFELQMANGLKQTLDGQPVGSF